MTSSSPAYYANEVVGPLLVGSLFNLVLYGVTCVQTLFYFQTYPEDNMYLKLLVATVWILETIQSGFTISSINAYLIRGFGDVSGLAYIKWDLVVSYQVGIGIIIFVNMYYTWRVWRLSKNIGATCLLLFLTISRFAVGMAATTLGFNYNTWKSFEPRAYVILAVKLSIAVVQDTLMASTLAYYLYTMRTARCAQLVTWLLIYIVATGALPSIIAIMELVTLWASKNSLLFVTFALIQVKVYANSALLSLNQRQYLRHANSQIPLGELVIAPGE